MTDSRGPHHLSGTFDSPPSPPLDFSVAVVIPARYGSTRFPGKPLASIAGTPMICHVMRRAQKARRVDRVLVATDDERIKSAVIDCAGEAVLTRPDHPSGTDRVWEAVADTPYDIIVNVQGDEPLLEPLVIDAVVDALAGDPHVDIATAAVRSESGPRYVDPNVVKVVRDRRGYALYFSRAPVPWRRNDGSHVPGSGTWLQHLGIYAYRRDALRAFVAAGPDPLEEIEGLEQLRALSLGMTVAVVEVRSASRGVDTPEDLERVEAWLRNSSS